MDDDDLGDLLSAIRELMRPHLERSEPLRRVVHYVGGLLVEEAERAQDAEDLKAESGGRKAAKAVLGPMPSVPTEQEVSAETAVTPEPLPAQTGDPPEVVVSEEIPLMIGGASVEVPVRDMPDGIARASTPADSEPDVEPSSVDLPVVAEERQPPDLSLIERRCRLKAEACRVFIPLRAAADHWKLKPPLEELKRLLLAEANGMEPCYLWVFRPDRPQPDDEDLEEIAQTYDALGQAARLLEQLDNLPDRAPRAMEKGAFALAAEASSMLRVALSRTWLDSKPDTDQNGLFWWLKRQTRARNIFVKRYMKLVHRADPAGVDWLIRRMDLLEHDVRRHGRRIRKIADGFGKIRHYVARIERNDAAGVELDQDDFDKIAEAIEALWDLRVPHSDYRYCQDISQLIVEVFPSAPCLRPRVRKVLEFVRDWYRDDATPETDGEQPAEEVWSQQVLDVRALLSGTTVVLIGGDPKGYYYHADRIERAFDLRELIWVHLKEHGTGRPMVAPISQPETRLVLVIKKLAGHLHGDEAQACCKEAGKPYVLLQAGYGPERIAEDVMAQASIQLRRMRDEEGN